MSTPVRVVAVEDNPADVRLLQMAFRETGLPHALQVLADGASALRFIAGADTESTPDLFVLDLHLPGYDGASILCAIRSAAGLSRCRVAVMTTCGSPEEEAEVKALGVDWYGAKARDWDGALEVARQLLALAAGPAFRTPAS